MALLAIKSEDPKLAYLNTIEKNGIVDKISESEFYNLKKICESFPFKANEYYLNLINWDDPNDPIKRIIFPCEDEIMDWGEYDASNEASVTVTNGVQHKYPYTVLLLCNHTCGGYCRYCFRKRVFDRENNEISQNVDDGINYIKSNQFDQLIKTSK